MRVRPVYRADGWVLCECTECRCTNYVEPHGTTAACLCRNGLMTEHRNIPFEARTNPSGTHVVVDRQSRVIKHGATRNAHA